MKQDVFSLICGFCIGVSVSMVAVAYVNDNSVPKSDLVRLGHAEMVTDLETGGEKFVLKEVK